MNPAKDQGPLCLGREGCNRSSQPSQGVPVHRNLFRRRPVIERQILPDVLKSLEGDDLGAPQMPHDQGSRHLEQVGLWVEDVVERRPRRQQAIGFLDHVIDLQARKAASRQPSPERGLVGQDRAEKPAPPVGVKIFSHRPQTPVSDPAPNGQAWRFHHRVKKVL